MWLKYSAEENDMKGELTSQGSLPPRGLGDEVWRLSGVENGVEGSSIKRKAFPSGIGL